MTLRNYSYKFLHIKYNRTKGIILNALARYEFIQNTTGTIAISECIEDSGLFEGANVDFSYANHYFTWYDNDQIYLTEGADKNCVQRDVSAKEKI